MFESFFILIGEISLSLLNSFKSISFQNIKKNEKESSKINSKILTKLNLEIEPQKLTKNSSKNDKLREVLLSHILKKHVIFVLLGIGTILGFLVNLEISGIYIVTIIMVYIFTLYYPQIKEQRSYSDLNQELPYALRHMGIELKSGKGLHDTLVTIKNANYGSISKEFTRVLEEIRYGKTTEESLLAMSHRVKSDGLSRSVHQIIGTLRVGGNLANSLDIIAEDISFDMRIRLKEYSQKLNSFILIYTFLAILAPVISLIMLMAGSTVMGDIIPPDMLFVIYTIFFPMVVMFMGLFIKKLEPKI